MRTSYDAPDTADRPRHWSDDALCRGYDWPDTFFPTSYSGTDLFTVAAAKAMCDLCPVVGACLSHALEHDERDGVWGGLTPGERLELQKNSGGEREGPRAAA